MATAWRSPFLLMHLSFACLLPRPSRRYASRTMRTICALLLLTFISSPLRAADTSHASDKKLPGISDQMKTFIEKKEITGAITLVADKTGIIHFDVVGSADVAGTKPMTPDAIFWIASMTKPITAT